MDLVAHRVFRGEREIHLSPTEFRLLRHFLQSPGRVFAATSSSTGSGARPGHRAAHGRRHHPPPAPRAQRRRRGRHPAHRARDRLRPGSQPRAPGQRHRRLIPTGKALLAIASSTRSDAAPPASLKIKPPIRSRQRFPGLGPAGPSPDGSPLAGSAQAMSRSGGRPRRKAPTLCRCALRPCICWVTVWMSRKRRSKSLPMKIAVAPARS